jgi:hypothetical protein
MKTKELLRHEVIMIFTPQEKIKLDLRTSLNHVETQVTSGIWVEKNHIIHDGGVDYHVLRTTDTFISNN